MMSFAIYKFKESQDEKTILRLKGSTCFFVGSSLRENNAKD